MEAPVIHEGVEAAPVLQPLYAPHRCLPAAGPPPRLLAAAPLLAVRDNPRSSVPFTVAVRPQRRGQQMSEVRQASRRRKSLTMRAVWPKVRAHAGTGNATIVRKPRAMPQRSWVA